MTLPNLALALAYASRMRRHVRPHVFIKLMIGGEWMRVGEVVGEVKFG